MDTKEVWSGEFGDSYLKRNRVDWRARIPFWRMILDKTGARSVFEFGANAGWNLSAIQRVDNLVVTRGHEINSAAIDIAQAAGLYVHDYANDADWDDFEYMPHELSFTSGVLIHIPVEELEETMNKIIRNSCDYVLAVEYDADVETEIEYRGQKGLLWKRPYGKLYQDMGLKLIETGMAQSFDRCRYWLMRK